MAAIVSEEGASSSPSNDRLEAIIASAMDAIITIDDNHRIIRFNPAAEQMFGIAAADALGELIERFIPHRHRPGHSAHIRHFRETGETGRRMGALGQISALRVNGEEFPVEASISQATVGGEHLSTVILRDVTARLANDKAQALLAREVDHRAKNILAIISSLVSLTRAPDRQTYVESLSGRIAAMSRAHGLLAQQRWKGASLGRIAHDELEAHADPDQFSCTGPDLSLASRAVQPIGMLLHELATNAVKYGALSVPGGRVDLSWAMAGEKISLHWREHGGPPIGGRGQPGFGSTLIRQIVNSQLGGASQDSWEQAGYALDISLPDTILQLAGDRRSGAPSAEDGTGGDARAAHSGEGESSAGGTLLIVEDEPLLAMQLSQSLEEFGWTILGVAGSIEDANRILSGRQRPDAAILDVDLGGSPVFPLARSLRRLGVPFIFCTGYEDLDYSREFADYTAVRKPASVLQIVRALRKVVQDADPATFVTPTF